MPYKILFLFLTVKMSISINPLKLKYLTEEMNLDNKMRLLFIPGVYF